MFLLGRFFPPTRIAVSRQQSAISNISEGFVFQRADPETVLPVENIKFYGGGNTPVSLEVNSVRHTTSVAEHDNMEDFLRWVWDRLASETSEFVADLVSEVREEIEREISFSVDIVI